MICRNLGFQHPQMPVVYASCCLYLATSGYIWINVIILDYYQKRGAMLKECPNPIFPYISHHHLISFLPTPRCHISYPWSIFSWRVSVDWLSIIFCNVRYSNGKPSPKSSEMGAINHQHMGLWHCFIPRHQQRHDRKFSAPRSSQSLVLLCLFEAPQCPNPY